MNTWWDELQSHFELRSKESTLLNWRKRAFADFQQVGLPKQKHDWWRSTPLKQFFSDAIGDTQLQSEFKKCSAPKNALVIHVQGSVTDIETSLLPEGVTILPIMQALEQHPQWIETYLGQALSHADGLSALNSALFDSGVLVHIAAGVHLDPTVFIHHQPACGQLSHSRTLVILEADASAQVLEYFDGGDASCVLNQVTEVILQERAICRHLKIQNLSENAKLQSMLSVHQQESSQLNGFLMQLGGKISSCDMNIDLKAIHAHVNLSGLFLPKDHQFHQQRLSINHHVGYCQSEQDFRGILDHHAQGVFIGRVYVAEGALKTEAHQTNKNLVLAKSAQMVTCPELQIYADDVICSHGATVGQLDNDALFYLQSRGFSEPQAKEVLVKAFVMAHFDTISDEALRDWCIAKMENE